MILGEMVYDNDNHITAMKSGLKHSGYNHINGIKWLIIINKMRSYLGKDAKPMPIRKL